MATRTWCIWFARTMREYVLRRPPLGPVAPKAHDMAREYRVLDAVHPHFPEAPQVFLLCEDPSVDRRRFFLMERRHGIVIRDSDPARVGRDSGLSAASQRSIHRLPGAAAFDRCLGARAQFAREAGGIRGAPGTGMGRAVESRQDRRDCRNGPHCPMAARRFAALRRIDAGTQRFQARQCDARSPREIAWKQCSIGR